jgi:hypothetical protein
MIESLAHPVEVDYASEWPIATQSFHLTRSLVISIGETADHRRPAQAITGRKPRDL